MILHVIVYEYEFQLAGTVAMFWKVGGPGATHKKYLDKKKKEELPKILTRKEGGGGGGKLSLHCTYTVT